MIRDAGEGDIEALASLMTELGYPTSTEDMSRRFEEISADPSYDTLIAECAAEIIGMTYLHVERFYEKNEPCARLMALVVGSAHRGQGVSDGL